MSGEYLKLNDRFDPEVWSAIYDSSRRNNKTFIFNRNSELVENICSSISKPSEFWLDIGCGTGHLSAKLSKRGLYVIGVDHDTSMIEFANKLLPDHSQTNSLTFITAKAELLPFVDNTIHGITAVSLIDCLSAPDKFFQEAYRVLHKNGFAIFTFLNRASLLGKVGRYFRKASHMIRSSSNSDHVYRRFFCNEVMDKLQKIGFKIIHVGFYNFFLNVGDSLIPPKWLITYFERLNKYKVCYRVGRHFIIVAQKNYQR
jgi:ubiquinone/menaquinone biosynthesis C-methylase UbiE